MYELLVLALLLHWPLYAYLIADIANHIIGPWEHISRGTLSSLLTRLEQAALITPAGRERLYQLMLDTPPNQGTYQRLFHIKALHLEYVSPEDQVALVDHYVSYCQMGLHYQQAQAQDFATNPLKQESVSPAYRTTALELMDLIARQWQLELTWAQRLRERIVSLQSNEAQRPGSLTPERR